MATQAESSFRAFSRHVEVWWPGEFTEAQKAAAYERLCGLAGVRVKRARGRLGIVDDEEVAEAIPATVVEHIHRTSNMSRQEFDLLQQTALKAEHLNGKVSKLFEKRRPRGEY